MLIFVVHESWQVDFDKLLIECYNLPGIQVRPQEHSGVYF